MDENQNILKNINSYFSKEIDLDQSVRLMKSFKSFYYDSELCNFLNELAGDYDKQNKYKEAIIIYRFLIEIGEFNPNCSVRDLLPLYDEIAQCYIRQKDFESAKYELEFCETLIDKPNSEFLEIRMLIDLSCCYYQLKQYEKMDTILNELLNIIDSEDYLKDDKFYNLDEIYYWLGYCHLEMKQFKSSAAYFMKCVESHEKCSEIDFNRIYKINKLIGDCHKYALQEENAIIWYFKLLEEMKKFQKNNKTLNYCELFLELGICYLQLCQPLTSMYWLRKVFDLYQNMKTLDLKKTYGKAKFYFSWCLNRVHNHEKAKQYSKDAIDVFQELEPCERPSELGDSYLMLGISHQFLLNRGESLRNYSKCLEIYQNTNDETNQRQYNTAICYLYMGICVFRLRNYHDSHEFLKKAKEFFIKSSSDDIRKIGFINWELAEASLKLNRIKEAITHYEEALNSFTKSDYHSMIINSNSMLGLCYKMLEKKTKAFKYHKTALSEMQKMIGFPNDELNEKNLTLFLDKFEEYKSNNILSNELQHLLNTTSVKLTDYFVCNKNYRTAVFYLSQLKTKIEEHCLLQQILTGLGYCLNRLRDYAKTIEIMNEGIVMCESQEYNDPIDIATFSLWQAKAYKQIKEYDLAEKTLLKCIEIYKSQSYQESALALVNYYYGSLKLETSSDPQEAISYFTKASEYYSSLKKPINQLLPLIDKYSSYSSFKEISGICLLINNLEVDCSNLNFIFSQLNFKVETFSKVDCAKLCEIREEKFDSINECSYRSLVMIIISEGDNEAVTLMGDLTVIDDITGLFSNETCPNLKDKPKVFIFLTKQEVEKIYSKDKKFSNHEESSEYLLVLDDLETKIDNNLKADGLTRVYLPPISDLFIWNVLFNNDKSFDIIFEVFKKYFRNTELMEIAKLSKKIFIEKDISSTFRAVGQFKKFFLDPRYIINECEIEIENQVELLEYRVLNSQVDDGLDLFSQINCLPKKHSGQCFIVNNHAFSESEDRAGTATDANNLAKKLLGLSYNVGIGDDMTAEQIRNKLYDISKSNELINTTVLVIVIFSHGIKEGIYGVDGVLIQYEEIFDIFSDENCPYLSGKRKIFFIQACRGDFEGSAVTYWDGNEANDFKLPLEKKNNHCKHNEMLIWYSTVKDYASYRDPYTGSWFICNIIETLNENSDDIEIQDLYRVVNQKLLQMFRTKGKKYFLQISEMELRNWSYDFNFKDLY